MQRYEIVEGVKLFVSRRATMDKIQRAGLPVPPKPEDAVTGTDLFQEWDNVRRRYGGIANIPYNELGEFLDRWTGMVSYARWCEAIADIDRSTAEEVRDVVKKQLYTVQEGNREIRDASVYCEPLYLEWELKYTEALSMYTATRALREGYEQRAYAISREISRRGSDLEDTRRGINRGLQA
jgi:hypothetical protein